MFLVSGRREGLHVQLRLGRVLDDGGEGAVVVEEEGELEPEAWRSPQLLSTLAIAEGREGRELEPGDLLLDLVHALERAAKALLVRRRRRALPHRVAVDGRGGRLVQLQLHGRLLIHQTH